MADRWTELAMLQKYNMKAMIEGFIEHFEVGPWGKVPEILANINANADTILDRMPYGEEIRGIAAASDLDLAELILFNLGYEIMGACTSVVAQDSSGNLYHGRNLDFGLFLGHNLDNPGNDFQWTNAEQLRALTVIVDFTRGGQKLYSAVVYVGYVGLLTGVRAGGVTLSVDSRFDENRDSYLVHWLEHPSDPSVIFTHLLRQAFEGAATPTFDDYITAVSHSPLVGPAYAIIGGTAPGQGAVLTMGPNMTAPIDDWRIAEGLPKNASTPDKWYVLETNYDRTEESPAIDDRVSSATDCMDNHIGTDGLTKESLYSMLHAKPNRNRLTTYTALMGCAAGTLEASLQYCWDKDCSLW
jgi:acid ceramidase